MFHTFDSFNKIWVPRHPAPVIDPKVSLGQLILNALARHGEKILQLDTDTGAEMSAHEMRLRAIRVAQNLATLGFRKGVPAALACSNGENLTPVALGLMIAGIPFITLPVGFNAADLSHLLGLVQPALIICDDSMYKTMLDAAGMSLTMKPVIFAVESERESIRRVEELLAETGNEGEFIPPELGLMRTEIAVILCTSGTTGPPKGVSVSQAHVAVVLDPPVKRQCDDLNFNFSPLYWGTGLFAMLNSLSTGTTRAITRSAFNEDVFFDVMERYKPTHFFTPPPHAVLLMTHPRFEKANFESLKSWSLTGSSVPPKLRKDLAARLPNGKVTNSYATTELGLIAMDFGVKNPDAVGVLMPHMSAKVVKEDTNGLAGVGEVGEILIRTSLPFLGYFDNEEATRQIIDGDGWVRTGDIGYLDDEAFVYLVGRKKDVIKHRGFQLSPEDLEAIIEKLDGVAQVCVIGLPEMEGTSDLPAAVVVLRKGSSLTEQNIVEAVEKQVSDHKRLRGGVYFWEALPMTQTGKILRRVVKQQLVDSLQK
ncbi:uncharacterized protein LOC129740818 [Uranotaenia lowii]|uniref:uncharacterized protein LOC129740818 n=1 Tax=Uranotaenia lowii TaxID=190385 RepID=UPI00247919BE|nr:uncharacterized protein LOC129740818 [Uranotaenia lowii]